MQEKKLAILITFAVFGLLAAWLIRSTNLIAQGARDSHEHTEKEDHQNEHEEHEEEEEHDRHGENDDHQNAIKLSDTDIKTFGIEVATASMGKLPVTLSLPGEVTVNEEHIAHVTPRTSGVVREVRKILGDRVHAGEILAILDSPAMGDAQVAYLDAKTALYAAKANIDLARRRIAVAKAKGDVRKKQIDVAKIAYELAVTNVASTKTALEVKGLELNIAAADLEWQETIHNNTKQLLKMLAESAGIDRITETFKGKAIGENRHRALKSYAELNFAHTDYTREKTLREKGISSESDYLQAKKVYTTAEAEFEAITEELTFKNRLTLMEKQRTLDAAGRDVKAAEHSVQSANGEVKSASTAVNAAQTALQAADMQVQVAEQDLKVTEQKLEVARSTLHATESKLHIFGLTEARIHALAKKTRGDRAEVTRYEMRTPFDGVIVEKHIVLGEAVKDDTEVFVIADLSSVWVNVRVYQKDLSIVQKGLPVLISAAHVIPTAKGEIAWVSPMMDEHTRTVEARVVLPNPDGHWRPGLFVTAKIDVDEIEVRLLVPKVSLQTIENQLSIFVQTDAGFEPKPVTLGQSTETYAAVTEGLQQGQRYVTKGAFTLKAQLSKGTFGDGHAH